MRKSVASVVAALGLGVLVSSPVVLAATCPAQPSGSCLKVKDWNGFKSLVQGKSGKVVLCGFKITAGSPVNLSRNVHVSCKKGATCRIKNGGNFIRIQGGNAQVTLQGFTFEDARNSAVRVLQSSRKEHRLCDNKFIRNKGASNTIGGGLRADPKTIVHVGSCVFNGNEAGQGGGIFSRGNKMTIVDSTFNGNRAQSGGGIKNHRNTDLVVKRCTFKDNRATSGAGGPAIWVQNGGTGDWAQGGDNSGSRNLERSGVPCDGWKERNSQVCHPFDSTVSNPPPPTPPSGPPPSSTPANAPFNYNPSSSKGPNKWGNINNWDPFYENFKLDRNPKQNRCGSGSNRQSPIDLCEPNRECFDHHEFREKRSDYKLGSSPSPEKHIQPNKLRLIYKPFRPAVKMMAERAGPDVPKMDFAKNGAGAQEMTHIDIKVGSEHTFCGKKFDAEMQMYYLHYRGHFMAIGIAIDASSNKDNPSFQRILDEFDKTFRADNNECKLMRKRARYMLETSYGHSGTVRGANMDSDSDVVDETEEPSFLNVTDAETHGLGSPSLGRVLDAHSNLDRRLEQKFDPHNKDFLQTIHYYAYDGSSTDPPCVEAVTWRFLDTPMKISPKQLKQLKRLVFDHEDPKKGCKKTSNDHNGVVTRPTQPLKGRGVWRCDRRDYFSDEERRKCGRKYPGCNPPRGFKLYPWVEPENYKKNLHYPPYNKAN